MGIIRMWYEWNWKEAEREFLRAIELKPGLPISHVYYNLLLVQNGRFEEAEEQIRIALTSDPLSVPANSYLAGVFHYRRDYDRSIEQAKRVLDIDPNDIEAHIVVGINLEQKREYPQAIAELEKAYELAGHNPLLLGPLGSCYGGAGNKEKALSLLEGLNEAAKQAYVAPISWVMLYLGVGDIEHAFEWLEKAAEARDVLLCYLKVGPIYDPIREDRALCRLAAPRRIVGRRVDIAVAHRDRTFPESGQHRPRRAANSVGQVSRGEEPEFTALHYPRHSTGSPEYRSTSARFPCRR